MNNKCPAKLTLSYVLAYIRNKKGVSSLWVLENGKCILTGGSAVILLVNIKVFLDSTNTWAL